MKIKKLKKTTTFKLQFLRLTIAINLTIFEEKN